MKNLLFTILNMEGNIFDVFEDEYGASSPVIYITIGVVIFVMLTFVVAGIRGEINKKK